MIPLESRLFAVPVSRLADGRGYGLTRVAG
jgi:hypothetical protein